MVAYELLHLLTYLYMHICLLLIQLILHYILNINRRYLVLPSIN